MPALWACFGAWSRQSSSLYPRRLRLNPSPGAKNHYSRASKNLSMPNRSLFLLLFLLLWAPALRAEPLSPPDLKALLGRIREKRAAAPQLQSDFQEEKNVKMLSKPISSSGKIWFETPNKFRREARGNSPSITVSDGQLLWIYYP